MFGILGKLRNEKDRTARLLRAEAPQRRLAREALGVGLRPWRESLDVIAALWDDQVAQDIGAIPGAGRLSVMDQFPFTNDLNDFAAEYGAGVSEVVRYALYSFRVYAAAGQAQLLHFQQNVAQATNGFGDTNMQVSGGLSGGEAFLVMNVRVIPLPAQADYDTAAAGTPVAFGQWNEVLNRDCWLELKVGDKTYIQVGPLSMFPSGIGPGTTVAGNPTVTRNIAWPNNGDPSNRSLWKQDPPTLILPTRALVGTSNWVTVKIVTTAGKLGQTLDGYRIRKVQ